ncbi:MAG: hypothetical protein WC887_02335 [Candidatus Paceibacterota bacterium]|jgi:hypothetical protein
MRQDAYTEHSGKAVEDKRFSHMMAITLNPNSGYKEGIIRCVTSREGDLEIKGYVDRSELRLVSETVPNHFSLGNPLTITGENEIVGMLHEEDLDFLGLEDPDIWVDEATGLLHLYFTIPFISRDKQKRHSLVHLGHAIGNNLDSLKMTEPVLKASIDSYENAHAKEVSIAPINTQGIRLNLFEGHNKIAGDRDTYSTVRIARARNMGESWEFGETVFHPAEHHIPWIGGHASPGPLFSKEFINVGEGKLLGVINGREANQKIGDVVKYGMFSIGLFIYDYENGKIDWVSPEPFIQDSEAKTITFASQFVETNSGKGILYAHVDDSFVRAYTLYAEGIRALLP